MAKRKIKGYQYVLYALELCVVWLLVGLIRIIPQKAAFFIADTFARFFYSTNKEFTRNAYDSLKIMHPDNPLPMEKQAEIIRVLFKNISRFGMEYIQMGRITTKNYQKYASFEGYENLDKALSKGKGAIVVSAHLGNWEYLCSIPAKLGHNVAVIQNRQFNPFTDALLRNIRQKDGKVISLYNEVGDIRKITKHLKSGGILGIVADQTYYFKPIFVPFFGLQAATADGPAKFHLKFGAPIVLAFSILQPDGRYLLKFEEPVEFEQTGDMEADTIRIMTWLNKKYEEYVIRYPEQWFTLIHGRWIRNQPEHFVNIDWDPF